MTASDITTSDPIVLALRHLMDGDMESAIIVLELAAERKPCAKHPAARIGVAALVRADGSQTLATFCAECNGHQLAHAFPPEARW